MDLSPNDIRNYEFPSQMRGYDKEEVDNFLEQVAVALEETRQQNLKLSMEVDSLKTQLSGLKEFEDTIKNAAIDARRNADSTVANAKKEAEEMLAEARKEAQSFRETHDAKVAGMKEKIEKLEQTKRSYISELRSLINSHLEMVDAIASADIMKDIHGESEDDEAEPEAKSSGNNIEVTESSDMTREKVETLSGAPSDEVDKTEEANAPDEEDMPAEQPSEPQAENKPVDPELAAALQKYQAKANDPAAELDPEDFGPAPPQGTIVETDNSAEDVPPGFIAKVAEAEAKAAQARQKRDDEDSDENGDSDESSSDGLAPDAQDSPTEHNAIDMDRPNKDEEAKKSVSPDELAQALDSAVTKFEEELDKAEKS